MRQFLFLISLVVLGNCKTEQRYVTGGIDPGWQMFNYPRTTMQPGYVFRIKDGEVIPQEVITLKTKKAFDTGYAYLPAIYEKKSFGGKAFLKFLFLNPDDSIIKAGGNKNFEVSMSIGKGFLESIDEPTVDDLVKNSTINWRENNKYYIVQATLSTKQIKYKSLKSGDWGGSAILDYEKINVGVSISRDKVDSTSLNQIFDGNYRIYYRVLEINSMGAGSSNNKKYTYKKVTIPIQD